MSTRCEARFLCWEPQAYVLYRMQPDGTGIRRLSHANLSEWDPAVMRDGRILWTRTEYLDKGADFGHTLWSIRPDGDTPRAGFRERYALLLWPRTRSSRQPGDRLHDHLARRPPGADRIDRPRQGAVRYGGNHQHHPRYPAAVPDGPVSPARPSAIRNRSRAIISWSCHNPGRQAHWGLYVIDRYGNRELLYLDPAISSKHPSLLHARPRPPVLPRHATRSWRNRVSASSWFRMSTKVSVRAFRADGRSTCRFPRKCPPACKDWPMASSAAHIRAFKISTPPRFIS